MFPREQGRRSGSGIMNVRRAMSREGPEFREGTMIIGGVLALFADGFTLQAGAPGGRRRGIDDLGERFDDRAMTPSPSPTIWLRAGVKAAAASVQAGIAAALQNRARRAAARRLEEDVKRLEEISLHLLEDIGVRKLQPGDFELLPPVYYQTDPAGPASVHDISAPPDDRRPPTRPKRSPGVTGKAA
jgi:uncharacterized protein YjiS (DUF1127 family)